MVKLTKKERAWIDELQAVLNRCPSPKKIGFYTTGNRFLMLYDLRRIDDVTEVLDNQGSSDWCTAVCDVGADIEERITFPSPIESTAG
ncbi:hypothetical protein I6G97_09905 [Edwardsiella hoshinae]|uniref:Uncharacterized protein n=1 Tax=Edwardsiella hoshinae TaxID=93378 RepID=A0A376DH97_9GAMM|nr:hypothetical protein [Edwardsiella hoshinae]QPR26794.1 hypothetical protein I6G97_09905 [Edwardsiella hoshinae]STC89384.1 Uncharacterised protein [Edwardsiella hoshinae]STE53355.1 Uncharacterised protein [Edwardsiella hoshinae]